ncbi:hypothetical protein MY5147_003397 [Beauveria neobassiana]
MRAVQVLGEKSSPQLSLSSTFPIPSATGDEVLIRVSAAAITADEVSWPEVYESNRIPGHDIAGTIVSLGADYKGSAKPGDEVFAMIKAAAKAGGQADYVPVSGSEIAPKPRCLSMAEAAALPIPVLTAWEALQEHAAIQKGDRILVTGASGAVGTMLVQIASKLLGAEVIALASRKSHPQLQIRGASHCVDYNAPDWESSFGSVDAVFDTVGSQVYQKSWRSLRQGGTMVTVADPPPSWAFNHGKPEELKENPNAKYIYFVVTANGKNLEKIAALFDSGVLKPLAVVEFEAEKALQAWDMIDAPAFTGRALRVVLADAKPDVITSFKKAFSSDTFPNIVATASTPQELEKVLSSTRCDAVLLDMDTFGEAAVLEGIKASPAAAPPVIYLSHNPDSDTLENIVLRKTAAGVVKKDDKTEDVVFAIEAILEGPVLSDETSAVNPNRLTPREREILKYLLEAMTTSEIASELHRSLKTIAALKQSGCEKLGVQSIAGLFKLKDRIV